MTETTTTTETTTVVPIEKTAISFGDGGDSIADWEGNDIGFGVYGISDNEKVEYIIADESIAKIVSADNTHITIQCLKEGTTVLTARTSDGRTAEIRIIVWAIEQVIW